MRFLGLLGPLLLIISFLTLVYCDSSCEENLSVAANDFTFRLMKKLDKETDKCAVSSPYSLYDLLGILLDGAEGKTKEQLNQTMAIGNLSMPDTEDAFDAHTKKLTSGNGNTLNIANAMFTDQKFTVKQSFGDIVKSKFHAQQESVDFGSDSSGATQRINDWVDRSTNGMIKKLFDGPVNSATKMILLNAIYFKGQWDKKFKKEDSLDGDFYNRGSKNSPSKVKFMNQKGSFRYCRDHNLNAEFLMMNYMGGNLSMAVALPDEDSSVAALLDALTYTSFKNALDSTRTKTVKIYFPKFDCASSFELNEPIKSLGSPDMFTTRADFSKIASGLYVSEVLQKAIIKVNEEGTEAAAVSAVRMMMKSAPIAHETVYFRVNRPFVFSIVHKPTNLILFTGVVRELPDTQQHS